MEIKNYEQSGFVIETTNGYKIAVDIGSYTPLEKLEGLAVDAVICSHLHGDHFSSEHIGKLSPKKLYLNQECIGLLNNKPENTEIIKIKDGEKVNIDEIEVSFFNVDHGPNTKTIPKENFGMLFEVDEKKIYFAGDIFYPSGIDVSDLEVDIALVPVGGFYTFGPQEAFDFVKKFKSIGEIIPIHYEKTPETKDEFLGLIK